MAVDNRVGNKVQKNLRREEAPATRVDPHPYIGIVKNNLDPTRSGRLQIWIPDLGGVETESQNWRTVSYASPFMGYTNISRGSATNPNKDNKFTNTPHVYGMWMVPPDIGVEVIVIFIAGDPLRGYWIACANSHLSRYMLPGIAASENIDLSGASADVTALYQAEPGGTVAPVTEFNEYNTDTFQKSAFYTNPKPIHEPQYRILVTQGLDRDIIRGPITSSSQRETPSAVFGISTPGRPFPDKGADNPTAFMAKVAAGTLTEDDYAYTTRQGGHSLIMDDGNIVGKDQLMRFKTAKGHQILLQDTENTIYINHADGTSWVEMTADGSINVFSQAGINMRSHGTINLHSDTDINMNAQNINMKALQKIQLNSSDMIFHQTTLHSQSTGGTLFRSGAEFNVESSSQLSLRAGGSIVIDGASVSSMGGGAASVGGVPTIPVNQLSAVNKAASGLYISEASKLSTIVTVAPTHEPYARAGAPATAAPAGVQPGTYTATTDATKQAVGTAVKNPAGAADLRNQPPCDCTVGNLTGDQLTAYFATIGKSESGGNYQAVNSIGFVGKYQFGYPALIDGGYVKSSCRSNAQLNNPNNWTGKNGIDSLQTWLNSPSEQEAAMCAYTKRNYTTMVKIGAVTADQPPEDVAGMLAVAHLLGPGGAKNYRNGANGADAYGTTGATYFQKGKYAVAVLAPQLSTVNQG